MWLEALDEKPRVRGSTQARGGRKYAGEGFCLSERRERSNPHAPFNRKSLLKRRLFMWLEALDEKPRVRGSTTSERQTGVCRSAKLMSARADKRSEIQSPCAFQ